MAAALAFSRFPGIRRDGTGVRRSAPELTDLTFGAVDTLPRGLDPGHVDDGWKRPARGGATADRSRRR